jgi:hypothetical protein
MAATRRTLPGGGFLFSPMCPSFSSKPSSSCSSRSACHQHSPSDRKACCPPPIRCCPFQQQPHRGDTTTSCQLGMRVSHSYSSAGRKRTPRKKASTRVRRTASWAPGSMPRSRPTKRTSRGCWRNRVRTIWAVASGERNSWAGR